MIHRLAISLFLATAAIVLLYLFVPCLEIVPEYYAKNIRNSLFTGFLTAGSFLLSLKAFVVVKLKENIYDSKEYRENLADKRKLNPSLTLYGPLKRLSALLFWSIISAITASAVQLTIGLFPYWVATFICVFVSVFALSMLLSTLILIKDILNGWLNYLEPSVRSPQ